jgi:hypothetical protein
MAGEQVVEQNACATRVHDHASCVRDVSFDERLRSFYATRSVDRVHNVTALKYWS